MGEINKDKFSSLSQIISKYANQTSPSAPLADPKNIDSGEKALAEQDLVEQGFTASEAEDLVTIFEDGVVDQKELKKLNEMFGSSLSADDYVKFQQGSGVVFESMEDGKKVVYLQAGDTKLTLKPNDSIWASLGFTGDFVLAFPDGTSVVFDDWEDLMPGTDVYNAIKQHVPENQLSKLIPLLMDYTKKVDY